VSVPSSPTLVRTGHARRRRRARRPRIRRRGTVSRPVVSAPARRGGR